MQSRACKATICIDCALRTLPCRAKISKQPATCCALVKICQTPTAGELARGDRMSNRFTQFILIAMVLGIVMGTLIFNLLPDSRAELGNDINLIAMLFLRLIKMIIAPLVFTTLVGGIAHMEDAATVGRIGVKTLGWFISASLVSLLIGLGMVHLLRPGAGLSLPPPE